MKTEPRWPGTEERNKYMFVVLPDNLWKDQQQDNAEKAKLYSCSIGGGVCGLWKVVAQIHGDDLLVHKTSIGCVEIIKVCHKLEKGIPVKQGSRNDDFSLARTYAFCRRNDSLQGRALGGCNYITPRKKK